MLELEDMIVMTKKRAFERGFLLKEGVELLAILYPEDAEPICITYCSVEMVLEFIREMNPPSVTVEGAINEDCMPLRNALCGHANITLH